MEINFIFGDNKFNIEKLEDGGALFYIYNEFESSSIYLDEEELKKLIYFFDNTKQ